MDSYMDEMAEISPASSARLCTARSSRACRLPRLVPNKRYASCFIMQLKKNSLTAVRIHGPNLDKFTCTINIIGSGIRQLGVAKAVFIGETHKKKSIRTPWIVYWLIGRPSAVTIRRRDGQKM